ncbi:MAG: methyltransferase domain-containing protein [Saprospiraceae bacterium]
MIVLSEDFKKRTKEILHEEYEKLEHALQSPCRTSIRLNPNKNKQELKLSNQVPWCSTAFYLDKKPSFTLDPYFHAGNYYVQEANSMVLEEVIKNIDLPRNAKVLDLCAAPGGKSTHLLSLLPEDAIVHCHEVNSLRAEILRQNIEKWGYPNALVTSGSIEKLVRTGNKYDLILVDAPCSGEGMFRKETEAIKQWNINKINHCVGLQNEIINFVPRLLKKNSFLIYSTCTYNLEENENIVQKLIETNKFESIPIAESLTTNLFHTKINQIHTYRCLPHRMEGEGYTFNVIRNNSEDPETTRKQSQKSRQQQIQNHLLNNLKNGDKFQVITNNFIDFAVLQDQAQYYQGIIDSGIKILSMGIPLGHFKGKDWFPQHALTQNIYASRQFPKINLKLEEALHYLRADSSYLPLPESDEIWHIIAYNDSNLGWAKRIDKKLKNYLPKNLRIHSL